HLSARGADEGEYDRLRGLADERRLGCRAEIQGDLLIDVPPESQVHRQVVRKGVPVREFVIDPVVRLYEVEVAPPILERPTGALRRLLEALEREWGLLAEQMEQLYADLFVVTALQPALDVGEGRVTVAIHDGRAIT